jgi:hypothetical protein
MGEDQGSPADYASLSAAYKGMIHAAAPCESASMVDQSGLGGGRRKKGAVLVRLNVKKK